MPKMNAAATAMSPQFWAQCWRDKETVRQARTHEKPMEINKKQENI